LEDQAKVGSGSPIEKAASIISVLPHKLPRFNAKYRVQDESEILKAYERTSFSSTKDTFSNPNNVSSQQFKAMNLELLQEKYRHFELPNWDDRATVLLFANISYNVYLRVNERDSWFNQDPFSTVRELLGMWLLY
jgi:putative lipase involved disintegration of autophagic bodies